MTHDAFISSIKTAVHDSSVRGVAETLEHLRVADHPSRCSSYPSGSAPFRSKTERG